MKIMIPLLSKHENNEEFLKQACEKAKEVILFLPVDTNAPAGFAMSEISQGEKMMVEMTASIGKMRKKADSLLEWGNTSKNIDNVARLRGIELIVLLEQDTEFFRELVKTLKKKRDYKFKVIALQGEPTKTN